MTRSRLDRESVVVIVFDELCRPRDPESMRVFVSLSVSTILFLLSSSFSNAAFAGTGAPVSVSDHRVKNLSCRNITADSVAAALKPEVFSTANHLPYRNWSFRYGAYELANCWSLSRFQRLYFYLREPAAQPSARDFSNQVRSRDMYEDEQGWKAFPLKGFWFLPEQGTKVWRDWERGWTESSVFAPRDLERGLEADIEYYQALRFHQLENIRYLKGPIERTASENQTTWSDLSKLVSKGRLPLILLRPDRYYQHVVTVKSIELTSDGAAIRVYDSNSPWGERVMHWSSQASMFYAYDIVSGMPIPDPSAPVGVFIVDRDENEALLKSLATHYQGMCAQSSSRVRR